MKDVFDTRYRQRGSVSVTVALFMVMLLAFGGLASDVGYVIYNQKRLQAAVDAAALGGAADLWNNPLATAQASAMTYTANQGDNTLPSDVTVSRATITGLELVNAQLPASGAVSKSNAIQVVQQALVPLYFARLFGFNSLPITASSRAAAAGAGGPAKYNVMIVLDTTASMNSIDSKCLGPHNKALTRLQCARQAAIVLLTNLTNAGNKVGLMTYPPLAGSKDTDFSCGGSKQSIASSYSAVQSGVVTSGATYQVSGLDSGFLKNGAANTSSSIVQALGGGNCGGVSAIGGLGTYYAQALASAQAALLAMSANQSPPGQNVIILLSDGDASASESQLGNTYKGDYGSECKAAVKQAKTIQKTNTLIYTVAYIGSGGSTTASCANGRKDLSPCDTMKQIASGPSYFFSDTCLDAAGGTVNLTSAFSTIAYTLTKPRLVPLNAM